MFIDWTTPAYINFEQSTSCCNTGNICVNSKYGFSWQIYEHIYTCIYISGTRPSYELKTAQRKKKVWYVWDNYKQ